MYKYIIQIPIKIDEKNLDNIVDEYNDKLIKNILEK